MKQEQTGYASQILTFVSGVANSFLVSSEAGELHSVVFQNPAGISGFDVKFFDGTDNTGTLLARVRCAAASNLPFTLPMNLKFTTGLFVEEAANGFITDIVVVYN